MKKIICLLLALVLCTALAIPAMAKIGGNYQDGVYSTGFYFDGETIPSGVHQSIYVEKNSSVKIDGAVTIATKGIFRIYDNGTLTITKNGSLSGTGVAYSEKCPNIKIVLENGAWIKIKFDNSAQAELFEQILQASEITCTRNDNIIMAGAVPACEHKNQKNVCVDCGEVISTYSAAGSILSEGSLTIIVGIAAAAVFGLGGFFLGMKKKKKPTLASGENKDEE